MDRAGAFLLLPALLLGCIAVPSESDAVMCDVATGLVTARALTQEASAKDGGGDKNAARQLAGQARTIAQQGHDRLNTITSDDVKRGARGRPSCPRISTSAKRRTRSCRNTRTPTALPARN